jgi:hydrogenase/urease accessory protein HupE
VQAHTIRPAVVSINVNADHVLDIEIKTNAEVLLAGIAPKYSDTSESPQAALYDRLRSLPPAKLAAEFEAYVPALLSTLQLNAAGAAAEFEYIGIRIEPETDPELARDSCIYLRTQLPSGSDSFVWHWPDAYGSNVLRIGRSESVEFTSVWLKQGQSSEPYQLGEENNARSSLQIGLDYVAIGFEHILPKGLDHILFVVGIFLLSLKLRPLLWQVTAFTLAHTITLGLSMYGVISMPTSIVEPLIALSIAYVGIENCLVARLKPWRIVLVFCFGLLHGLGFAGVLSEIGLPRSEFLTALITFNVGVELGQLAIILSCFLLLGWWRKKPWYRSRITVPLSLLIAVTGLYWTWERIFS